MQVENAAHHADPVVLRVEGVFDALAARALEASLVKTDAGARVDVDLTHVREFPDFAIAVLADALPRSPCAVAVHGLGRRQLRVLRYFGVEAGSPGAGAHRS